MNKSRLVERIAELVNERKLDGISDLRDESDREGMRIVIELKRDAVAEVLLNQLYKHTPMQESFGINMLAIVDGRPKLLSLKDALVEFLTHRRQVIVRRRSTNLRKAEERLHILAGLKIAIENLDQAIAIIRGAADPATARDGLHWHVRALAAAGAGDPRHAPAAADGFERDKIVAEYTETEKLIQRYREILRRTRGLEDHRRRAARHAREVRRRAPQRRSSTRRPPSPSRT